jgi:flavin-dependent dehydrogenase
MTEEQYDVIIVGAGPAGSTAGTLLAQYGHRVLMIEQGKHPRFHIGESLLPMSAPIFQRLGLNLKEQGYLPKGGAEFINEQTSQSVRFPLDGENQPYQVERAQFDLMLAENALKQGAELHQEERVKEIDIQDDGIHVNTDKRTYSGRYFIDASGRHTLMGKKQTSIKKITNLGRYSLYTHYRKLTSQAAQAMHASGDIKILMLDIGWFWIIPLTNNRMSIGLVVQKNEGLTLKGAELFNHYFQASPFLHKLLEGAEQETSIRTEADFSFTNEKRFGARYACCGDSAGFLDPVFSSGVFIAVNSAERIADRVHQGFKDGTEADPTLHQEDDKAYTLGFRSMQLFVERFYQHDMVHRLFFEETRNHAIEQDITGILSGDLWTDSNAFQNALLNGRQSRRAS